MRSDLAATSGLVLTALFLGGCPIPDAVKETGSSSSSGGESSSSSVSSSSSSSSSSTGGGAGGNGGAGGMAGAGGMGGGAGAGGMGGGAGTGGMGGNGDPPVLVMIATGMSGGMTTQFVSSGGWSSITPITSAASADPPAFAIMTAEAKGVAVWRSNVTAEINKVKYAAWDASTGFASFGDLGAAALARETPAIAPARNAIHVAYLEAITNDNYYYAKYDGAVFQPKQEQPGMSVGKCSPALVSLNSTDVLMVNPGWNNDNFYDIPRTTVWGTATPHTYVVDKVTPAIVALDSAATPTLLAVVTKTIAPNPPSLHSAFRKNGMWDAQTAPIMNAASTEPVLLALPNGDAILTYRDANKKVWWTRFTGMSATWSMPRQPPGNMAAKSKPALALGAGDAEVELLFVDDTTSKGYHSRLRQGAMNFDPPVEIPGATGLVGIAAATNL